jgi:hypothetical protein
MLPVADNDLILHVQIVLQIRLPRPLEDERRPSRSSTAINRWPWSLLEPVKGVMAEPRYNFATPWSCVRLPERRARVPSLGARRMLVKLGELHQSLCLRPARNPGAVWSSTCLNVPCEQGPNLVLEATVLRRERPEAMLGVAELRWGRPEVTLAQFGIL